MKMVELNDLLPSDQWEDNWTILGDQHAELSNDKEYVIFEYYCSTPDCYCKKLVADIKEIGSDGKALKKSSAIISYDWSTPETSCQPMLLDESPKTKIALELLEVYKKHIHCDDYLARIKGHYVKVKELGKTISRPQSINPNRDISRNDPCPCGSKKKFKKCCLSK